MQIRYTLLINFPLDGEGKETKSSVETNHDSLVEIMDKLLKTVGFSSFVITGVPVGG